jgi:ABC-type multidrug transport system ATPase subunit
VTFGRKEVLKTASFAASAGRITALMGRNGAGKTTLFRAAVGRVRPDGGRVLFGGEYIGRPSLADLARRGLMYSALDSALTGLFRVRDHVRSFLEVWGGEDLLPDVVERLELDALMERWPHQLSGGERQRVALALASLRRPRCLIMDEPFGGVAPLDRVLIAGGLRTLRDQGTAIAISGHEVDDLFEVSDELIWVVAGTTHWLGTPSQAAQHHEFRKSYLGPRGTHVLQATRPQTTPVPG